MFLAVPCNKLLTSFHAPQDPEKRVRAPQGQEKRRRCDPLAEIDLQEGTRQNRKQGCRAM